MEHESGVSCRICAEKWEEQSFGSERLAHEEATVALHCLQPELKAAQ